MIRRDKVSSHTKEVCGSSFGQAGTGSNHQDDRRPYASGP
nr:MAG TPA: hypothetical protein [Caudoviricetes sp.]